MTISVVSVVYSCSIFCGDALFGTILRSDEDVLVCQEQGGFQYYKICPSVLLKGEQRAW